MDTKMEHGLNFRIVNTTNEFLDLSPRIRYAIHKYLVKSQDKFSADDLMTLIQVAIEDKTFYLFIGTKGDDVIGIMTAHATMVDNKDKGAMISIGWMEETLTKEESDATIKAAMDMLFAWAKDLGMKSVFARTMRNERPFDRLLGRFGFTRITTVYEKEIDHGQFGKENSDGSGDGRLVGDLQRS